MFVVMVVVCRIVESVRVILRRITAKASLADAVKCSVFRFCKEIGSLPVPCSRSFFTISGRTFSTNPVSYTHLDVYKRQPSIFRQSPVFHILAGAPVSQFNPCSVGGITHPEGMVSPAQGLGWTVISNGGRFGPVERGWILAQ